jgi:ATP-binding cassette, subfamily B, bacterial
MQNPYWSLLRTAWSNAKDRKRRFLLIYGMFVVSNIVVAMNPLFYGWFVNELQKNEFAVLNIAWIYVAGFLGLRLLEWSFHGPARVMERQLAFHISRNFLDDLFKKVLSLPVTWHQDHHSGSTISRLRKGHEALRDFFQSGFIYLYSFGKFIFSFAAMIYFSPLFGAIGVALGALTVYIIIQFDKPLIRSLREVNEREHEVSSTLFDGLSNILSVISLRLEGRIHGGLLAKVANVFPPFKRNVSINEWKWFVAQMMVGLIYATITIGYIYQHYTPGQTFMIGGLIILLGYVNQFTSVFNDIASQYNQILKYNAEVENVRVLESAFASTKPKEFAEFPSEWRTLEIENLNFIRVDKKSGRHSGIIDLKMKVDKGQKVALVGESGSGKSTLLTLLRGLNDVEEGTTTLLDGNKIPFASIANTVTLFPQEPEIFENTILYNITLGLPFNEGEVLAACRAARFEEVVQNLPEGLQTNIKEKGVNLSGGQKQRLALARGILAASHSTIVLLDEPTSSIDPRTEKNIYQELFRTFANKAIISSLHRLHLLENFDYIYILKDGAVIDEGSFQDLKRFSLVFQEMWKHQETQHNSQELVALKLNGTN